MDLINTLKNEHQQILDLFDQIDHTDELNELKDLVQKLITVTTKHLQEEDSSFYPVLAQSQNQETQKVGTVFSSTMPDYVSDFTKVAAEILNLPDHIEPEILADYQKIRDKIKNRITIEETILFPSFI